MQAVLPDSAAQLSNWELQERLMSSMNEHLAVKDDANYFHLGRCIMKPLLCPDRAIRFNHGY